MRLRTGGGALIGRQRGIALHQCHPAQRHAELFGHQLRLRRIEAVTELAFTGVRRHVAVRGNGNPGIELIAAGAVEPLCQHDARLDTEPDEGPRSQARCAEPHHERAGVFQEGSALHAFTPLA
jgi:hypothetical protein